MKVNVPKTGSLGLPPWAKGVVAVAIILGVGFATYKIVKGASERKKGKTSKEEEKETNKELDDLIKAGKGPTLSKSQMSQFANQLFTAMDGYGTDEDSVIRIFGNVKNDADVYGVVTAYGVRELSSGKFNPEPNKKGTLGESLSSELSSYWLGALNKLMTTKGIKRQF